VWERQTCKYQLMSNIWECFSSSTARYHGSSRVDPVARRGSTPADAVNPEVHFEAMLEARSDRRFFGSPGKRFPKFSISEFPADSSRAPPLDERIAYGFACQASTLAGTAKDEFCAGICSRGSS